MTATRIEKTECPCGKPGTHRIACNDWACDHCWTIDNRRAWYERPQRFAALAKAHKPRVGEGLPVYPMPTFK